MLCAKEEAGSETWLTIIVLVFAKIVGQFKIIESFGLKPVSHLTVTIEFIKLNYITSYIFSRSTSFI